MAEAVSGAACVECGRPVTDAYLCGPHTTDLRRRLHRIAELADELPDTITRLARVGSRITGSKSRETPLPWNEPAAQAGRDAHDALHAWAAHIAGDNPINVPTCTGPACQHCPHTSCRRAREHANYATAVTPSARYAHYLAAHIHELRRAPVIADIHIVAVYCHNILEEAIDRARQRIFPVGPCTEQKCGGILHAVLRDVDQLLPPELRCDACGFTVPATRWKRWAREARLIKRIRTRAGKAIA